MIKKLAYSFSSLAAWLASSAIAHAQGFEDSSFAVSTTNSSTISPVVGLIYLVVIIVIVAGMWKLFTKAGKPGWASIIPIYNLFVLLDVAKRPMWWFILLLIPFVNIFVSIVIWNDISRLFGKGVGFTLGLVFLPFIFVPILGFGSAAYRTGNMATPYVPPQPQA
jgi:hypothetical protein